MLEIFPIKTKIFEPPQEDILPEVFKVLDGKIKNGDVIVITSKIVSINEGRCIPVSEVEDKEKLVEKESEWYMPAGENNQWSLSYRDSMLVFAAGIDESNAKDHYVLLPEDSFKSAHKLREELIKKFSLTDLGVVIIDSHVVPFRKGSVGVAIGCAGIEPVKEFAGKTDLFGRQYEHTRINVVDSIASLAMYVMGETTEQTPVCIVRNAPHLEFTEENCKEKMVIPLEEDMYYPLIKDIKN